MPKSATGPARFAPERKSLLLIAVAWTNGTGDYRFSTANAAVFVAMFAGSKTERESDEKKDGKFRFHSGVVF